MRESKKVDGRGGLLTRALAMGSLLTLIGATLGAGQALAADNDVVLSRFATFDPKEFDTAAKPCVEACGVVKPDVASFNGLVTDLGEVFAPRFANPAETLGEAGFAVGLMTSFSFIPNDQSYWQTAVEDRAPEGSLFTGHLQVRKGLPFSFEVAGNMGYLFNSEMFTVGADLKWSLNEGFYYLPDVAVRGSVNTLLGGEELNLITAGGDVSISKDFGLGGVMSIAPYMGYQNLYIIGSSRLINAYPQDPRPPQYDPDNPNQQFSPEFVFEQYTTNVNRFFLGARLNVWILSFVLEGVLGNNVNQFTFSGGVDF